MTHGRTPVMKPHTLTIGRPAPLGPAVPCGGYPPRRGHKRIIAEGCSARPAVGGHRQRAHCEAQPSHAASARRRCPVRYRALGRQRASRDFPCGRQDRRPLHAERLGPGGRLRNQPGGRRAPDQHHHLLLRGWRGASHRADVPLQPRRGEAQITDDGVRFDPWQALDPDREAPLESRVNGGSVSLSCAASWTASSTGAGTDAAS